MSLGGYADGWDDVRELVLEGDFGGFLGGFGAEGLFLVTLCGWSTLTGLAL